MGQTSEGVVQLANWSRYVEWEARAARCAVVVRRESMLGGSVKSIEVGDEGENGE